VAKYKNEYFSKTENQKDWHLFPNPSYNFVSNNIHIYIDLYKHGADAKDVQLGVNEYRKKIKEQDIKQGRKERDKRKNKTEIIDLIYKQKDKGNNIEYKEPTALLSLNELQALLYELLVNKKTGKDLEDILVEKIVERYNTIKTYDTNQNLSNSFITKNLKKSISNQDYLNTDKLLRAIDKEIDITNEKLELIESNRNETTEIDKHKNPVRKYVFYTNELGQEATWLTNDLIRFMPKVAKQEWKGYQHSELQRFIAFYDRHRTDAKDLLSLNWDLKSSPIWGVENTEEVENTDAFINRNFDKFYESYLINRKSILEHFILTLNNNKDAPTKILKKALNDIYIVFDKRLYTISSIENQKKQLLAKPIVFPRGIFDDKPTFIQGCKIEEAPERYADWYSYCYQESHEFQKFYNFKRDYTDLFNEHEIDNKVSTENKKELTYQQKFDLFKMKQDLIIKKIKHKDLFIKLMVDSLLKDEFNTDIDLSLKEFYQTQDERKQNQIIADQQKDRDIGDKSGNIFNDNFIWNKTISLSLLDGRLLAPEIKLKDIGKFKKLESDEKVKQILSYNSTKIWSKLELEDELENKQYSYEKIRREELLKSIHLFEKQILEKHNNLTDKHPKELESESGNPKFRKYIENGVLRKIKTVPDSEINWFSDIKFDSVNINEIQTKSECIQKAFLLIVLRNKFGHNQLPDKAIFNFMQKLYSKEVNETYSSYFLRITQQIITEFEIFI
jgi:hypothetical protein